MKNITILLLLLLPYFAEAQENSLSFKSGKDTFEFKYKIKEVTTSGGLRDLVLYSVYKNGKFIHSEKEDGGRLFSCKYKQPEVKPIKTLKNQIGWMLFGGGVCGNTSSYVAEVIIPVESYSTTYYSYTLISKEIPLIDSSDNEISIWYFEQNWGNGGTATSFFVPSKVTVNLNDDFFAFKKGNILSGIEFIEKIKSNEWLKSFLGFYIAGIRDVNPELMQYALDNYYTEGQKEWISVHLKSGGKQYLKQLIDKVRITQELLKETSGVVFLEIGS
ncbi:MAG: hypothetical protein HWE18_12080 [Gammaproteobacteria bacterium]|nr:hypothetical protein [Gammaproteobacteria bacterium]